MSDMSKQSKFNWDNDTWTTLDNYFNQDKILVQHQIDSFNNMVDFIIPQIIEKNNPIIIGDGFDGTKFQRKITINFGQTYLSKPLIHENTDIIKPLYPNEARLRGLTYAAPMFIDMEYSIVNGSDKEPETKIIPKIPFMKLPIMLHSKYCHLSGNNENSLTELGECEYDQGGYFVVNGGEKVIISQERVAENQVYVFSKSQSKTAALKYTHIAEIKTSLDQRFYPVRDNKVMLTKEPSTRTRQQTTKSGGVYGRTIRVKIPWMREEIPLFIMFRALGIITEKEMLEMIMPDHDTIGTNYVNFLIPSIDEARLANIEKEGKVILENITTQTDALEYLSEKLNIKFNDAFKKEGKQSQLKYVRDVLGRELFPHIGQMIPSIGQTFRKKAFFLGYMTRKLIDCYFGVRPYDDRDHYSNKRVDVAGPLITKLFRTHFIKLISDLKQGILAQINDTSKIPQTIRKIIQGCNIDSKIKYGLSTGNWATQKTAMSSSSKGIAQVLNRLSFSGALSHTRRIQSPLEKSGSKIVPPRRLHGTHFGMCCPNETPEGQQIGVVKNLSMQTHVTIQTSDYPIRIILNKLGVRDLIDVVAREVEFCTKIFVNGEWYGTIHDDETEKLYKRLKILKRHGIIVPYISIAWFIDWKEIRIQTDSGRYSRPVYVVEDDKDDNGHYMSRLLIEDIYLHDEEFRAQFKAGNIKWQQLLYGFRKEDAKSATLFNGGLVEYLDTNETENSMIAMTYADMLANKDTNQSFVRYTHCEIHPMMMMGVVACTIPFSDHNQSPRNCYQCLWKEEEVVMSDGSLKKIGDIKVGEYVITVDPDTLEQYPSKVINQYVKPTEKKIVKVTTLSGRTVVCTDDHPILTCNGWKPAATLTDKDLICVSIPLSHPVDSYNMIISEYTKYGQTMCNHHNYNHMSISEWCEVVKTADKSIFVPIMTIEPHDNVEIADITVESETHSFITGQNICVHNSSMAKQSIGYYVTNYNSRMDTMAHVLVYGHRPLVSTRAAKYVIVDKLPHGATSMLLYACYTG